MVLFRKNFPLLQNEWFTIWWDMNTLEKSLLKAVFSKNREIYNNICYEYNISNEHARISYDKYIEKEISAMVPNFINNICAKPGA